MKKHFQDHQSVRNELVEVELFEALLSAKFSHLCEKIVNIQRLLHIVSIVQRSHCLITRNNHWITFNRFINQDKLCLLPNIIQSLLIQEYQYSKLVIIFTIVDFFGKHRKTPSLLLRITLIFFHNRIQIMRLFQNLNYNYRAFFFLLSNWVNWKTRNELTEFFKSKWREKFSRHEEEC